MLGAKGLRWTGAARDYVVRNERKAGGSIIFHDGGRFGAKRIKGHHPSRILISKPRWRVRRGNRVHTKPVIGRRDLCVRLQPIGAYPLVGIIDMGVG